MRLKLIRPYTDVYTGRSPYSRIVYKNCLNLTLLLRYHQDGLLTIDVSNNTLFPLSWSEKSNANLQQPSQMQDKN